MAIERTPNRDESSQFGMRRAAGVMEGVRQPLGFAAVALNVTKLRSDNIDPRDDMQRLEDWKVRVEASGGRWRVINDLARLDPAFLG